MPLGGYRGYAHRRLRRKLVIIYGSQPLLAISQYQDGHDVRQTCAIS